MNKYIIFLLTIFQFVFCSMKNEICQKLDMSDKDLESFALQGYLPIGFINKTVTIIDKFKSEDLEECFKFCCEKQNCDAAIYKGGICSIVHCKSIYDCQPRKLRKNQSDQYFILLKFSSPVNGSWTAENAEQSFSSCEMSVLESCAENQFCQQIQENRRTGVCVCNSGFIRKGNECVQSSEKKSFLPVTISTPQPMPKRSTSLSYMASSKSQLKTNDKNSTNKLQVILTAGSNVTIKILRSSIYDNPEIIRLQGLTQTKLSIFNSDRISYSWERLPESLAVGKILNDTHKKPELLLVDLLEGQYFFQLTATTDNGIAIKSTVKLNVIEIDDEISSNLVDIVFNTNIYHFTEKEKNNFSRRMGHIIDNQLSFSQCIVRVHSVSPEYDNDTLISFYAKAYHADHKKFQIISSGLLENELQNKIVQNKYMFNNPVKKFQSRKCYNSCSGHGFCDRQSHRCNCFFPWFNNKFHEHKTGLSNCDMHVMIIVVACSIGFFLFTLSMIVLKKIVNKIRSHRRFGRKVLQYRLLDDTDS